MRFAWMDYSSENSSIVESWMDQEALRYTGCDGGWAKFVEYWDADEHSRRGDNFWCKVVYDEGKPFSALALFLTDEGVMSVSEFVVKPDARGKGLGTAVLSELLMNSNQIIGKEIRKAGAVIFPSNTASINAFTRAGFYFDSVHPDGDILIYKFERKLG